MDKDMAASFLNSVLNQLNWAFSEFIGMIQEVRFRFTDRNICSDNLGLSKVQLQFPSGLQIRADTEPPESLQSSSYRSLSSQERDR